MRKKPRSGTKRSNRLRLLVAAVSIVSAMQVAATSIVQTQLTGVRGASVLVNVDTEAAGSRDVSRQIEREIKSHVEKMLAKAQWTDDGPRLVVDVESSEIEGCPTARIATVVTVRMVESVQLSRDPRISVPNGATTWMRQTIEIVPREKVAEFLRETVSEHVQLLVDQASTASATTAARVDCSH